MSASGLTVVRESAEAVLRDAWSIARVEVVNSSREAYGFLWLRTCGFRTDVEVLGAIKGPSESMTILTLDRLEPGRQYLVATRRFDSSISTENSYVACRLRHQLHGKRVVPVVESDDSLFVSDPRGELIPPYRHYDAPDRPALALTDAISVIKVVLETDSPYPPPGACRDGSPATMRGSKGDGNGSRESPWVMTYAYSCGDAEWYTRTGETGAWVYAGDSPPSFLAEYIR